MSDIIILSDSDESTLRDEKCNKNVLETKKIHDADTDIDFDFPEVPFYYDAAKDTASQSEKDSSSLKVNNDFTFNNYGLSHIMSNSCDSEDDQKKIKDSQTRMVSKKVKISKEERLIRQQALARDKTLKTIMLKRSKDIKPGECFKFMEINLDRGIDTSTFREVKNILQNANVKFNIIDALIPNSITWQRNIEENYVGEDNEIYMKNNIQAEKYIIVIWNSHEAVTHVAKDTFCASILDIKVLISNYNMILIIFGMEEYFAYQKKRKSNDSSENKKTRYNNKGNQQFDTFPIISKQQLEMCLTEIQIIAKCSNRLIENPQDLGLMIYQYTKSISEIPYKLQKKENQQSKFDWYVMGDNRNTVHVDKDGNGLKRLWQQQLCQFNLSSLETAEAICTVYSSPAQLIKVYIKIIRIRIR
jgi:crossover junction endonuclease EME1